MTDRHRRPTRPRLVDGGTGFVPAPAAEVSATIDRARDEGHAAVKLAGRVIPLARIDCVIPEKDAAA